MPTNNPTVVVNQSDGIVGIESDGQHLVGHGFTGASSLY